jgi:hypothetical protein
VAGPVLLGCCDTQSPDLYSRAKRPTRDHQQAPGPVYAGYCFGLPRALAVFSQRWPGDGHRQSHSFREITAIQADARRRLQLHPDYRTVVVFGGSQGGLSINRAMRELAPSAKRMSPAAGNPPNGYKSYEDIAWEVLGNDSGQRKGAASRYGPGWVY